MPSTDPQHLLSTADRQQLLTANLERPFRRLRQDNRYGHTVHRLEAPAHDLTAMSDIELVDLADRSVTNHFGGTVTRLAETTVDVKVWTD